MSIKKNENWEAISEKAKMSNSPVIRVYWYENVNLRFAKNVNAATEKKTIKKKIESPSAIVLLKVWKTICDLVNTKKLEGIKSTRVL